MSFMKLVLPAALLSAGVVTVGLVALERSAALPFKPSVLLRAWSGDLPTSDLPRALALEEARLEDARQHAAAARAAVLEHQQAGAALGLALQGLEARLQEKEAAEWGAPVLPR